MWAVSSPLRVSVQSRWRTMWPMPFQLKHCWSRSKSIAGGRSDFGIRTKIDRSADISSWEPGTLSASTSTSSARRCETSPPEAKHSIFTDWLAYKTFDIIGDMALGEPFGCLTSKEFHFWVPLISQSIAAGAMEQATRRIASTGSWLQNALLKLVLDSVRKTRRQHLEYSREKILKRMGQTQSQHKDSLFYLMKQAEGGALDQNEIIVNGALFIIAGTESTAGFLSGLFNQLLRPQNKDVLVRMIQEIRQAFEEEEDIRFEELVKLPYLSAVIDEGLRIFPSAPIGFTRTVPRGGDTVVAEHLPGGVSLALCCLTDVVLTASRPWSLYACGPRHIASAISTILAFSSQSACSALRKARARRTSGVTNSARAMLSR